MMRQELNLRNDIQGLRAIAVLAVMLFHLNKEWLPGGFMGVDIFLVISGYLITSIVLRQMREVSFSFSAFYLARIRRIVPAYLVLLCVVSLVMMILLIPQDFGRYIKSLKAALYFISNNFFADQNDYFAPEAHELPLLHTWSLGIEMQFYLLLPAILAFIPKRFLGPALLVACTLILSFSSFRLFQGHRQAQYFSLIARIPEFFIGSLLALWPVGANWNNRISNFAAGTGLLLLAASFWLITEETAFPGLLALPPCLGAALLIAAGKVSPKRLLSTGVLVWIGDRSYSLYLWHWPILAGFRYFLETYSLSPRQLLTTIALTFACSYLSYRYVELPFREKKSPANLGPIAALAAGALITIWASLLINPKLVDPLPKPLTRYAKKTEICHGKIVGDCLRGDKTSNRTVLMLGDSHAAQLNYFADVVGNTIHAKIRVISASGCVTIPGFDIERIKESGRESCLAQIEQAGGYLQSSDVIIIAGKWKTHSESPLFMEALDRFLGEVKSRNQSVIVLAQIPMLESNVQRAYRFENLGLRYHPSPSMNEGWEQANHAIKELVSKHKNSVFLDLSHDRLFADAPFKNDVPIYRDSHHLNEFGSRLYGEVASDHLAKLTGVVTKTN